MKKELEARLIEKYPKIFINVNGDCRTTCMCWGLECDDGWYSLIDKMCSMVQWNTDKNRYPQVVADQVKEKWGTLNFYYHTEGNTDDYKQGCISGIVDAFENMSATVCENCGQPGEIRKGGWLKCLCDECVKNNNQNEIPKKFKLKAMAIKYFDNDFLNMFYGIGKTIATSYCYWSGSNVDFKKYIEKILPHMYESSYVLHQRIDATEEQIKSIIDYLNKRRIDVLFDEDAIELLNESQNSECVFIDFKNNEVKII